VSLCLAQTPALVWGNAGGRCRSIRVRTRQAALRALPQVRFSLRALRDRQQRQCRAVAARVALVHGVCLPGLGGRGGWLGQDPKSWELGAGSLEPPAAWSHEPSATCYQLPATSSQLPAVLGSELPAPSSQLFNPPRCLYCTCPRSEGRWRANRV